MQIIKSIEPKRVYDIFHNSPNVPCGYGDPQESAYSIAEARVKISEYIASQSGTSFSVECGDWFELISGDGLVYRFQVGPNGTLRGEWA